MKSKLIVSLFLFSCFSVSAAEGGYEAGKAAPDQQNPDAGYKGSEDTQETRVSQIRDFRQNGYVTLEGYIVKKVKGNTYQFRDPTGTINIMAQNNTFKGKTYSAEDLVRVSGRVHGHGDQTMLNVTEIDEP